MRIPRTLTSIFILLLSILLMGQSRNCGDLSNSVAQIDKWFAVGNAKGNIFLSNLPFLEINASLDAPRSIAAEDINAAVEEAMKELSQHSPRYAINVPGHTLQGDAASAKKFSAIFWDPNLSLSKKKDKMIHEFMLPNGIDGLIAGQFVVRGDGGVTVRVFLIARPTKSLITETASFQPDEFSCRHPKTGKKFLCDKAIERMRDLTIRICHSTLGC